MTVFFIKLCKTETKFDILFLRKAVANFLEVPKYIAGLLVQGGAGLPLGR